MNSYLQTEGTLILREVAGEFILIPTGETALKMNGIISLSVSGALLWKLLEKGCQRSELTDAVLKEYETDRETAESDVAAFLNRLKELELLKES